MDLLEALYTTRAMRRVTGKPIPQDVQALILDAAVRAPSGGNAQDWRFLLVDAPEVRSRLQLIYRQCVDLLWTGPYRERAEAAAAAPNEPSSVEFLRLRRSVEWAADHFTEYPLLLLAFASGDGTATSVLPAVWSAMLAARSQGVGSALTSALALKRDDVLRVLNVPRAQGWQLCCCVTFGYPIGRWGIAPRRPADQVTFKNYWGTPLDFAIDGPIWRGSSD